nr:hypothetical protein [Hoylesella pleuritidis]
MDNIIIAEIRLSSKCDTSYGTRKRKRHTFIKVKDSALMPHPHYLLDQIMNNDDRSQWL